MTRHPETTVEAASCSELTAALNNKAPKQPLPTTHASCLTESAGAVREVARKIGKTKVKWDNPKSVMVITKPGDYSLVRMTRDLALWLIETPRYGLPSGITVYVDEKLKASKRFRYKKVLRRYPNAVDKLKFWNPEMCVLQPKMFDFIITLGGDGTVLFSSWLFQNYIPPVIPFHLGSLGFLTPFDFDRYDKHLTRAMENGVRINLRGRLTCTVYRQVPHMNGASAAEGKAVQFRNVKRNPVTGKITVGGWCSSTKKSKQKKFGEVDGEDLDDDAVALAEGDADEEDDMAEQRQIPCFTTVPVEKYEVINELVVDRGPSPYVSLLELFGDDKHLTTVQADGLAISTPTGSTAYSLSAGGSLTHPEIHATLITPICPHTLSFRPTLVPDSMELRICVPYNSRTTAWASFDGRGRVELKQGDHVKVTASKYPFPTVCKEDQAIDWFNALQKCLHWNKRQRQKSFAVVENNRGDKVTQSMPSAPSVRSSNGSSTTRSSATTPSGKPSQHPPPHSPPSWPVSARRPPLPPSGSSNASDVALDEVFGLFIDDDDRSNYFENDTTTNSSTSSLQDESHTSIDSEEDGNESEDIDDLNDGFIGWSDEEIAKARYMATVVRKLEEL
ncbi:ATP-NAD kinase-like domain-containing protein [Radiomyces spectabilis]|uniref:ATP-NAD kinase-like domain-containing protein n=1 Tax=Radiomyces spectabilis TaxID=64574 RepID=UPI00221EFA72|nr:ATP-NAD kinase-like domain-containing protein [Radiomyces spectabilis]KAI8384410.1 ATP-NAD kinase-like domain-containing protein [Radiomyces spectabilis]